jgi:3,4-dihydroxy 2-butanone 4-phosphate synthase/GTP cyclohydrolase II
MTFRLDDFSAVLADIKEGKQIILVDDENRENEGDLVILSQFANADAISFMLNYARGLICVVISSERARHLGIPLQVMVNSSPFHTPFGVSVDLRDVALSGVTATSRAATIQAMVDQSMEASHFRSPGHVFPLIAHFKGVLGRRGQTEGSFDLARIVSSDQSNSNLCSAVVCEVLNDDGTMMRGDDLRNFADRFGLKITSVEAIHEYRLAHEPFFQITREESLLIGSKRFMVYVFEDELSSCEHIVLVNKEKEHEARPIVRIHSECLTGDLFGSRRCDCGWQLDRALDIVADRGYGAILYLRQEGRGVGLANKIKAYSLQDANGCDTVDANKALGLAVDCRDFRIAGKILKRLGFNQFDLLTNNPQKLSAVEDGGLTVVDRIALKGPVDEYNEKYLNAKRSRLGHLL